MAENYFAFDVMQYMLMAIFKRTIAIVELMKIFPITLEMFATVSNNLMILFSTKMCSSFISDFFFIWNSIIRGGEISQFSLNLIGKIATIAG